MQVRHGIVTLLQYSVPFVSLAVGIAENEHNIHTHGTPKINNRSLYGDESQWHLRRSLDRLKVSI